MKIDGKTSLLSLFNKLAILACSSYLNMTYANNVNTFIGAHFKLCDDYTILVGRFMCEKDEKIWLDIVMKIKFW